LLHAAVALGLYALIRQCGGATLPALLGSLIFAAHPMNVEVAFWITARDESISAATLLFSLLLYLRAPQDRPAVGLRAASLLLFALSLATKEYGFVFPLALLALPVAGVGRLGRAARASLPYVGVIAFFLVLRWIAFGHPLAGYGREAEGFGAGHSTLRPDLFWTALASFARSLIGPVVARPVLGAFWLVSLLALIVTKRHDAPRQRVLLLLYWGLFWSVLFLLPTHNLVYTDRHLYLSFAGVAVALGLAIPGARFRGRALVELASVASLLALVVPPTLTQEKRFDRMSLVTERSLKQVAEVSKTFADGDVLVLVGMPAHVAPPWGFGWSLSDALGPPFLAEKLEARLTVITRRAWRDEAWQTYRGLFPGREIQVLLWDPEELRIEVVREARGLADQRP